MARNFLSIALVVGLALVLMPSGSNAQFGIKSKWSAEYVRACRDAAMKKGKPIPGYSSSGNHTDLFKAMNKFWDQDRLRDIRYVVGGSKVPCVDRLAFFNSDVRAITLDRVIVFRNRSEVCDLELWAHEIGHVQEYRSWKVHGFVKKYVRQGCPINSSCEIEREADRSAREKAIVLANSGYPLEGNCPGNIVKSRNVTNEDCYRDFNNKGAEWHYYRVKGTAITQVRAEINLHKRAYSVSKGELYVGSGKRYCDNNTESGALGDRALRLKCKPPRGKTWSAKSGGSFRVDVWKHDNNGTNTNFIEVCAKGRNVSVARD